MSDHKRRTITELRTEQEMTQFELAVALGVTPGAISSWERGIHEPRASQLRALADLFGVRMDDIEFATIVPAGAIANKKKKAAA